MTYANRPYHTSDHTVFQEGKGVLSDVVGRLFLSVSERVGRIVSLACAGVVGAVILASDPVMAGGVRQASAPVIDAPVSFADDVNKNIVLWEVTLAEGAAV